MIYLADSVTLGLFQIAAEGQRGCDNREREQGRGDISEPLVHVLHYIWVRVGVLRD